MRQNHKAITLLIFNANNGIVVISKDDFYVWPTPFVVGIILNLIYDPIVNFVDLRNFYF